MFERRLKIFLAFLGLITFVLVIRAAHVQVIQKEEWRAKATEQMKRSRPVETVRGDLLDFKGRVIASDEPCIDACVDFRAMIKPADEKEEKSKRAWVEGVALERLRSRMGDEFTGAPKSKRRELLAMETARVQADLDSMWGRLAKLSGRPLEQVEAARDEVIKKVNMRRRYVWYRNYELAMKKYEQREPAPAWRSWLIDETAQAPTPEEFTKLTVAEELSAHPILKAVSNDVQNELRKRIEDYPGLVLKPGVVRHYPYNDAGCHLIGQLSRVTREDLEADPNFGKDELRSYFPNDLIGRTGLEKLAEPLLRGSRGRVETVEGQENELGRIEYTPGKDVRTTIDIELQREIVEMFRKAKVLNEATKKYEEVAMHGGAVVMDVESGDVRALVSFPTFDLNRFEEQYVKLVDDDLNFPLLNRATQVARVPGSTVKPMVGLAGIAAGVCRVHEGIECNGFMQSNGRNMPSGRCWTQSMFGHMGDVAAHHQIPYKDPHVGSFGNSDGWLNYSDAVQRSCNVYFETIGDRLKLDGLSKWYTQFGLGRRTGLGIPESRGSIPSSFTGRASEARFASWIAAIGQGTTTATPIQMANVCATIARGGVWTKPRLIPASEGVPDPTPDVPERVDLGLPRDAVAAAVDGMKRVVNTPAGSAYNFVRRDDLMIAGKTGTAEESSPLKVAERDANGNVVYEPLTEEQLKLPLEEQQKLRRPRKRLVRPSNPLSPNPEAPWYRGWGEDGAGTKLKHSWFIGFAPADNPKVAFAVMLEYGGSGGAGAGMISKEIITALINHNYLQRDPAKKDDAAQQAGFNESGELLHHADHEVGD